MKIFWFLESADEGGRREDLRGVLRSSRWALWSLLLTCAAFLTWAYYAEIDQVTRAPGSVISSARSQIIQSQDGGVIEELMVKEGDVVQRDQVLVKIDGTRQQSSYLETRAKAAGLAITVARLQAEVLVAGGAFRLPEAALHAASQPLAPFPSTGNEPLFSCARATKSHSKPFAA
jgi:adhesin transport system membrane fusion protein